MYPLNQSIIIARRRFNTFICNTYCSVSVEVITFRIALKNVNKIVIRVDTVTRRFANFGFQCAQTLINNKKNVS